VDNVKGTDLSIGNKAHLWGIAYNGNKQENRLAHWIKIFMAWGVTGG